jgi:chemotaxis signal transduction protein
MSSLVCQLGELRFVLPLSSVAETMRPLPIDAGSSGVSFVTGNSTIRGAAGPVIDLGLLLAGRQSDGRRWVTLKPGPPFAALAVDAVLGVRTIADDELARLPALLPEAGTLDALARVSDAAFSALSAAKRLAPEPSR